MYKYSICNQADEEIFLKQCNALERKIPGLIKQKLLIDVDNSKIQEYILNGKKVTVYNSNYDDEVYVKSEVDLLQYFNK